MPAGQLTSWEEAQFPGPPGSPLCSRKPLLPWVELRRATPMGFDRLSIGSVTGQILPQEMPGVPKARPREDHDEPWGMGQPGQVGIWRRAWQEESVVLQGAVLWPWGV